MVFFAQLHSMNFTENCGEKKSAVAPKSASFNAYVRNRTAGDPRSSEHKAGQLWGKRAAHEVIIPCLSLMPTSNWRLRFLPKKQSPPPDPSRTPSLEGLPFDDLGFCKDLIPLVPGKIISSDQLPKPVPKNPPRPKDPHPPWSRCPKIPVLPPSVGRKIHVRSCICKGCREKPNAPDFCLFLNPLQNPYRIGHVAQTNVKPCLLFKKPVPAKKHAGRENRQMTGLNKRFGEWGGLSDG
jgi:hypothetical protein